MRTTGFTVIFAGCLLLTACLSQAAPTATPTPTPAVLQPTPTLPPTATPVPKDTPVPPTPTPVPTNTPVPPTSTPVPPTPTSAPPGPTPAPPPGARQEALVVEVVDGDTIVVEIGGEEYRVRYIGIDTPETHHPSDGADWLGFEATDANAAIVKVGETVILEKDISETDIYDRLLRYVWVGDTFVNAELVRMGLARVLFYDPDVKYKSLLLQLHDQAVREKRGVHGPKPTPPAEKPVRYRGIVWTTAPEAGAKSVVLRYDPARGEPIMAFPVGLQTRLVDAFWVPEDGRWWYWIGVNGFNGWTTGEYITVQRPDPVFPGPGYPFEGYEVLYTRTTDGQVPVHTFPGKGSDVVGYLEPGSKALLRRISWEEETGEWWYFADTRWVDGWVAPEYLVYENP